MDFLKSLYDNAMANAERVTGGYASDPESRWGLLVAVLAAVAAGLAIRAFLKSRGGDGEGKSDH